jgi:hypothetical protein
VVSERCGIGVMGVLRDGDLTAFEAGRRGLDIRDLG